MIPHDVEDIIGHHPFLHGVPFPGDHFRVQVSADEDIHSVIVKGQKTLGKALLTASGSQDFVIVDNLLQELRGRICICDFVDIAPE